MAESPRPAIGLSVGAPPGRGHRRPLGHPQGCDHAFSSPPGPGRAAGENPVPDEAGLVITDFVDRVGDPVPVVAADGSVHPGRVCWPSPCGRSPVSRPGTPAAARGRGDLPGALARPGRRGASPRAAPDAGMVGRRTAADIRHRRGADRPAGRSRPAHPRRGGVVRLRRQRDRHHVRGGGVPSADRRQRAAPRLLRRPDRPGRPAHVVAELSAGGAVDTTSTSAIGSLTHLRAECRAAKERLSSASVTSLPAQLRGFRGDVRLTRTELDDAIAPALAEFVAAVQDGMACPGCARRSHRDRHRRWRRCRPGGHHRAVPASAGARDHHPAPGADRGDRRRAVASRGPADDSATALAPAAPVVVPPVVA